MIGDVIIVLSAAVAVIALLDLFTSEDQKKWFSQKSVELWSVVDDWRRFSFLKWVRRRPVRIAIVAIVTIILATLNLSFLLGLVPARAVGVAVFAHLLLFCLIGGVIAYVTFSWILASSTLHQVLLRGTISVMATILFFMVTYVLAVPSIEGGHLNVFQVFVLRSVIVAPPLSVWLIVLLVLAAVYAASTALTASEFIARRTAEYPKGPLLAISALCGSLAALFKAFG